MASRIQGITIEIDGNTSKLQQSLKSLDGSLRTTQSNLRDIDKLLKLDPKNTELLTQKQKNLESAIKQTSERLAELKNAQAGVKEGTPEWDALQREIIETEQKLKALETEYKKFGSVTAQQIAATGRQMQELGKKVDAVAKALAPISTAAGGALTAIGGLAYKAISASDDLNTMAKQTGLTTEELQMMQFAADRVDVSVDDITGAIRKMKGKMDEGNETFQNLGVSVTNADGSLRNANDVFFDSLKALSEISNETERDQIAMELFGKGADQLAGIIDDGGAALREYGQEAKNLGLIMSQDTLDALNEVNDTIDRSKAVIGGSLAKLGATAAQVLAPMIEKVAGVIDAVTEKLRNLTPEQTELIMKILAVVAAIAPLLSIGGKLISFIGKIMTFAPMIVTALSAISPLTIAIVAGIAAVIAIGVALYKNWDTIKEKAAELWSDVKSGWEKVKTGVTNVMNGIKSVVSSRLENIKAAFVAGGGGIKGAASAAWTAIKQYYIDGFNALNTLTGGKLGALASKFASVFSRVITTVKNAITKIKNLFKFDWKLPTLKVPHVKVDGGEAPWGIGGKGRLPSFEVEWYKRAYNNPVLFTQPTVLQTPQGYKGFGDGNGAEIVMGLDKLRELVGGLSNGSNVTVQVVLEGDARQMFKAVQRTNFVRTKSTNYNALAGA
jgi:phage-related minor tail protein